MKVRLAAEIRQTLGRAGAAAYPAECCGLLVGRRTEAGWEVYTAEATENQSEAGEQHHRYVLDPRAFLRAQRAAERAGLEVVGFFHSHPDHPAAPSQFDTEHAWPGYVYVIVRVTAAGPQELTAWELDQATGRMGPVVDFDDPPALPRGES